jgi:hypothetical protein
MILFTNLQVSVNFVLYIYNDILYYIIEHTILFCHSHVLYNVREIKKILINFFC